MSTPQVGEALAGALEELILLLARQRGGLGDLEPLPLTWTQKLALTLIADREPLRLHTLAELMQTTDPTATRTVDALAAQRLAARVEDPSDRRGVLISATHQGRRLVEERRRRLRDALATTMAEIPLDEQQRLAELLYHLNGLLDRNRPRAAASLRG